MYDQKCLFDVKSIKKVNSRYRAIIEINKDTFQTVTNIGKLKIGWSICSVYEHVDLIRCFKCYSFHHMADKCSKSAICSKCGENDHNTESWNKTSPRCINCVTANANFGFTLPTNHSIFDKMCPVFQKVHINTRLNGSCVNC